MSTNDDRTSGPAGDARTPLASSIPMEVFVPADAQDGVPVVILLHGRGADRTDLFSLRRFFPSNWAVIAPDAPFPAAPWGYGPGRAWYQYLGEDRPEPSSYSRSIEAIDELIESLPAVLGHEPGPIALGGFSQGGTVSIGYALTHPDRVINIVNFSGFLANHPAVRATPETVAGAEFFWGHGTSDPNIPFPMAMKGRTALADAGARLDAHDYVMGHSIGHDELRDAIEWLRHRLGERG